nr:reverse transcriptase domain-containing protein [Tanacetum cinerariifolium]
LMNAGELPEMDPYEEVAQQGQAHLLSPAYIPDPMELDEHAPVYVLEPQHPEYHAPSHDDIQAKNNDDDPEEDPSKEHEPEDDDGDLEQDPNEEHESKGSEKTEPFEEALIDAFASGSSSFPLPPTSPAYDQAQLESLATVAARAPRSQFDFVDTVEAGQGLIRSPGHDTRTIARATDRAEDASYVRALQASERRMMTSIEEVNLRVSYQAQLEVRGLLTRQSCRRIMPVTRQGTNDAMTSESIQAIIDRAIQRNSTHTQDDASQSSGEGLRRPVQPARVCSYIDFMKCQPLNFKGNEGVVGLSQWLEKMESVFHISGCAIDNQLL